MKRENSLPIQFYRVQDYRVLIDRITRIRKKSTPAITFVRLAEALRVQKTYISKVIRQKAHLNQDQLFSACTFLGLSFEESKFIELLLEYSRSENTERKKNLYIDIRKTCQKQWQKQRNTDKNLKAEFLISEPSSDHSGYYLDPICQLVHLFLTIPKYRNDPKKIADSVGISSDQLRRHLESLETMKAIEVKIGRIHVLKDHIHLHSKSPLNTSYQALFRLLSGAQVLKVPLENKFQVAVTFSADEETKSLIEQDFLAALRKMEMRVKAAPSKEVYQFNLDLFPWANPIEGSRI